MNRHVYGVIAVTCLCLLPAQSSATPNISWSRQYIKRMLIPGQVATETATFTPSANLSDVTLTLTPALQPFVMVSQSYFRSIYAGQSYSITLKSTIPSNEPLRTLINGTV